MTEKVECVKVAVRCRPMNTKEKNLNCSSIIRIDKSTFQVLIEKPDAKQHDTEPKNFTFDAVFGDESTQKEVYEETAYSLVINVLDGYNGTIFAYGQTGCGKTFTMEGVRSVPELRGIIPCTFDQIFAAISLNNDPSKQFLVRSSYLEIYNEEVRDLLSDNPKNKLEIKEDPEKGVYVKGLLSASVTSVEQINKLMENGNTNRTTGATLMNQDSSRSHAIFTVTIETSEPDVAGGNDAVKIKAGKLNLVDLAGSERQSKTQATGQRLKEGAKINLSLSALGNVISALVANAQGKNVHVPYRDSKLTRLLQDSLGGNTKTIMIANISPADYNYEETMSTLRYANRAKNIKNKPRINEDPKDALLREYQDEITRLKRLLEERGITDIDLSSLAGGPRGSAPKRALGPAASEHHHTEKIAEIDDQGHIVSAGYSEDAGAIKEEMSRITAEKKKHEEMAKELEERMKIEVEQQRIHFENEQKQLQELLKIEREKRETEHSEVGEKEKQLIAEQQRLEEERKQIAADLEQRMQEEKSRHEQMAIELQSDLESKLAEERQRQEQLKAEFEDEKSSMKTKLKKLQQKLMGGEKKIKDIKLEELEKRRKAEAEAREAKKREAMLREEKIRLEEEKVLAEEKISGVKEEMEEKSKILKKLKRQLQQMQVEMEEQQTDWENEKEEYLANVRDAAREVKLYKAIVEQLLSKNDIERIVRNSVFDEDKDAWTLPKMEMPMVFPVIKVRPPPPQQPGSRKGTANGINPRDRNRSRGISGADRLSVDPSAADAGWKRSVAKWEPSDDDNSPMPQEPRTANGSRPIASRLNPMGAGHQLRSSSSGANDMRSPSPAPLGPDSNSPDDDPLRRPLPLRPAFSHSPNSLHPSTDSGSVLEMELPKPRPRFDPTPPPHDKSPTFTSLTNAEESMMNMPRRPAFEAAKPVLSPAGTNNGNDLADNSNIRRRPNFEPATHTLQPNANHDPLPSNLPTRAPFQPAANQPRPTSPSTHLDPLKNGSIRNRPNFQPASFDGNHDNLSSDDPLSRAPPPRPQFKPGDGLSASRMVDDEKDDPLAAASGIAPRPKFEPGKLGAAPLNNTKR